MNRIARGLVFGWGEFVEIFPVVSVAFVLGIFVLGGSWEITFLIALGYVLGRIRAIERRLP